ncbi:MAG: carboxypeptidase regulatory-like domain-containing protein [Alphaproteobacteria bacterium]|nr:carboxypeptidase regulatory-like domain-containing protein [Alphaproteobacteria bacterium]MCB9793883.1 carboxypeptidase regulatory-like domain-containing protein [Alphaproteobacteria bacterium]
MGSIAPGPTRADWLIAALIAMLSFGVARLLLGKPGSSDAPPEPDVGGEVTLRLVDPEGQGVGDCAATIWLMTERGTRRLTGGASQKCGSDGRLRWTGREPGDWRVMVQRPGLETLDLQAVVLNEETLVDLGEVTMRWAGDIVGHATEDGQPVVGAEVRASTGGYATTGPDGSFHLPGMPVGEVGVQIGKGHSMGAEFVQVERGETHSVEIVLEPQEPRGTVGFIPGPEAEVLRILPSSPAEGVLEVGDHILAVDGKALEGSVDRLRVYAAGRAEEPVTFRVLRGEEELELTLTRVAAGGL